MLDRFAARPVLALMLGPMLAQEEPAPRTAEEILAQARLINACGSDPGTVCGLVLRTTGNATLARMAETVIPPTLQIILVVVLAYLAHRIVRRVIKRFVRSLKEKGLAKLGALRSRSPLADTGQMDIGRATLRTETLGGVLRSVATFIIFTLAALSILGTIGVNLGPLIAGAGIAGVAIGFGAQNLVKDFLAGLFMLLEDQYGVGDIVDTGEASGTVEEITLRVTRLRDLYGTVWYIPNGEVRRIGNKSQQWARALLDLAVAYDTDIPRATAVIKRVADELWQDPEWSELVLEEPEVWGIDKFGANEIIIRLVVKTVPLQQWKVERELRGRLKAAFDADGIEIPFPQRTVWMRTGPRPPGSVDEPGDEDGRGRVSRSTPPEKKAGTAGTSKRATTRAPSPRRS
jgi:moderate conductance mechanosensitive channel